MQDVISSRRWYLKAISNVDITLSCIITILWLVSAKEFGWLLAIPISVAIGGLVISLFRYSLASFGEIVWITGVAKILVALMIWRISFSIENPVQSLEYFSSLILLASGCFNFIYAYITREA